MVSWLITFRPLPDTVPQYRRTVAGNLPLLIRFAAAATFHLIVRKANRLVSIFFGSIRNAFPALNGHRNVVINSMTRLWLPVEYGIHGKPSKRSGCAYYGIPDLFAIGGVILHWLCVPLAILSVR